MIVLRLPISASPSFSAPLPGARVTFSCLAKRKSPKRRPPRCCAFRPSMDERYARPDRACRRAFHGAAASGRNPLRPPCGPDRPCLTAAQGPRWARVVRARPDEAKCRHSPRPRPWMADSEATNAPLHDAEKRSRSREQGAHVRAQGCASSRRRVIGEHRRGVSATRRCRYRRARRNDFGYFCRNKSNPLAAEASGTRVGWPQ